MERSHARDASDLHGSSSGTNDDATASKLNRDLPLLHDCDETLEKGKGAHLMIEFPLAITHYLYVELIHPDDACGQQIIKRISSIHGKPEILW
ncbi:hypothetical protein MUK42_36498 [Musa troglodytarum]|uniref:Uncharacterized protein n=1 Tax=Musa troglodytarum TaxID=320322 RepID=A0A9E7FIV8_9LILI|nr:hypothetical protein MUK42_36498 [Musa troglodytarum]